MSELTTEQREFLRDILSGAIPVNPVQSDHYVSREEFEAALRHIDVKIDNATLRQKLWVMGGVLSMLIAVFASWTSLVSKIDRLTEALPQISQTQSARSAWIQRTEQRDARQDDALQKLDRDYQPVPYKEPPQ